MPVSLTNGEGQALVSDADHLALARLVTEATWRVDEGKADLLSELFVDDGVLDLGDTVLKGRAAIRAWGRQLEKAQTYKCIRHIVGNVRFVAIDELCGASPCAINAHQHAPRESGDRLMRLPS